MHVLRHNPLVVAAQKGRALVCCDSVRLLAHRLKFRLQSQNVAQEAELFGFKFCRCSLQITFKLRLICLLKIDRLLLGGI